MRQHCCLTRKKLQRTSICLICSLHQLKVLVPLLAWSLSWLDPDLWSQRSNYSSISMAWCWFRKSKAHFKWLFFFFAPHNRSRSIVFCNKSQSLFQQKALKNSTCSAFSAQNTHSVNGWWTQWNICWLCYCEFPSGDGYEKKKKRLLDSDFPFGYAHISACLALTCRSLFIYTGYLAVYQDWWL